MKQVIVAGFMIMLIQGCSLFTPPKAKPVIEDRSSSWGWSQEKVGVLATTPERRVVVIKWPDNKFCAEPPADAADNVSAALTLIAEAAAKGQITQAQLGIASSLATTVKQLFQRSQGVQLYRDGTFMLCNAYLNGAITPAQFLQRHEELLKTVTPLIDKEIPELHKLKLDSTVAPIPPNAPEVKFFLKPPSDMSVETDKDDKKPK
jgi:hypothetical protein